MVELRKEGYLCCFLDPQSGFERKEWKGEIRWDPLTGDMVRVFELGLGKLPEMDMEEMLRRGTEGSCPFCPGALEKVTPKFDESLVKEGRMRFGEVTVLPNRLPFDKYSGVVVLGNHHYVPLSDLDPDLVFTGLLAAQRFLKRVVEVDPGVRFISINWNYLPMSGGSVIHPHLQAMGGELPTNYQGRMIEASRKFYEKRGRVFWEELIEEERRAQERYLGSVGRVEWLTTFAPRGYADITAVFPHRSLILDLEEDDLRDFSRGLERVFRYYVDYNHYSFNLSIYSGEVGREGGFWVNARMVTRRSLPPVGASDVNYFEKLHGQAVVYKMPERLCEELRGYFR